MLGRMATCVTVCCLLLVDSVWYPVGGAKAQELFGPPAQDADIDRLGPPPAVIPNPLDRAAAIAADKHPLVRAAEAESDALEAKLSSAKWLRYPSLSVDALAATRGSSLADRDGLAVNATIEQPIWAGGRIGAEIDRARANSMAGLDRVIEAQVQIVLDVTAAYYDYVLAAERTAVIEESLAKQLGLLASIERRVEQEVSPQADLMLGRSRTAQLLLDLAEAKEQGERAKVRLAELTGGVEVDPVLPPASLAQMLPQEDIALAEALACSPTLAALTDLVDVAEAKAEAARGNLFPQVLLQLSQNEITGARAAVVLRAQTGNGLSRFSDIRSSDARIQRAMAEFGEAERRLREQLRREYVMLRASSERIEAGVLAADTTSLIIDSYQRQFIAGRRSWLDVMNAVREASNARISESEARVSVAAGSARIMALSCNGQPGRAVAEGS